MYYSALSVSGRCCVRAALFLLFAALFSSALAAQEDPAEQEQYQNGLPPAGTYSSLAGLGAVNLHNGGFTLSVPILSIPGRAGHNVSVALTYNSKQISRTGASPWAAARWFQEGRTVGRWTLNALPELEEVGPYDFKFTTPDGAVHNLHGYGTYAYSDNSTNIRYDKNLMRVQFLSGHYFDFSVADSLDEIYYVDPNGNRITYHTAWMGLDKITDTLGREVDFVYSGPDLIEIRAKNHAGADNVWTLSYTNLDLEISDYSIYYNWVGYNVDLLSGITLPNGTGYAFSYDYSASWGTRAQMTQMTLPTGAVYSFLYTLPSISGDGWWDAKLCQYLDKVTVDPVGGGAFTTDFDYVTDSLYVTQTTEIRADGSKRVVDWNPSSAAQPFLRQSETLYDTDGTTVLTNSQTSWIGTAAGPGVSQVDSTNPTRRITRKLDSRGREIEQILHDFRRRPGVSGYLPLQGVRRWFALDTVKWQSRLTRQDRIAYNAYGPAQTDEEYVVSSSEFRYDEFALTDRGTVTGQAAGFGPAYANRGNLTTTAVYFAEEDRFIESHSHYDTLGNVVKSVDPLDRESTVGYSASDHYAYPASVANPLGHTATTVYDFETGLVLSATDANSNTTAFTYDAYNRRKRVDYPDGGYRRWTYDDTLFNGKYRTLVRAWGPKLNGVDEWARYSHFDGLGRLIRTKRWGDGSGDIVVEREYALCGCTGRSSRVSMPRYLGDPVYWTETEYDGLGRVRKIIPPDGSSTLNYTEYRYFEGRTTVVIDAKGQGRTHFYDVAGTLLQVGEDIYPAGSFGQYAANAYTDYSRYPDASSYISKQVSFDGQTLTLKFPVTTHQLTEQGVQQRRYDFDGLGRLIQEMHPEHRTVGGTQHYESYTYDDAGRMLTRTDPRAIVTTSVYDDLNRPLTVTYSDGTPQATYTYDQGLGNLGRLSAVASSVASSTFEYDVMGRVTREEKTVGGLTFDRQTAYNLAGQVTSYTLPNGKTVSQDYDRMGRLTAITSDWVDADHPAVLASNLSYHATGALSSIDYGNGTSLTRSYTTGGLLKTLQHGSTGNPGSLLDLEYHYDEVLANNARIMSITDHNDATKTQYYTYDGLFRLATAETQGSHWGLSFAYDRYGNRLSQTATKGTPPTDTASVDAYSNRVTNWSYDQAGNVLDDTRHSYVFDANNKIVSMDSGAATYDYDAQGSRVEKTVGGLTTSYFWGHEHRSGWIKFHVYLGNEKLAEYSGGTTHFYHANHLGTPAARTDVSGTQDASWSHYPFGEEWTSTGGGNDQHRFTGHMRDSESDNDYAGARYLESGSGRWLAADEFRGSGGRPQTLNRFSYSLNDPVNYRDPDGRMTILAMCTSTNESRAFAEIHSMPASESRCTRLLNNYAPEAAVPQSPPQDPSGQPTALPRPCSSDSTVIRPYSAYDHSINLSGLGISQERWAGLSQDQQAAFLNIHAAMEFFGVSFENLAVDFGFSRNGSDGITSERVFLSGSGVQRLYDSVTSGAGTLFWDDVNGFFHDDFQDSFKRDLGPGSLQFSFNADRSAVDIDLDPNRGFWHVADVIVNRLGRGAIDPYRVRNMLEEHTPIQPRYFCGDY